MKSQFIKSTSKLYFQRFNDSKEYERAINFFESLLASPPLPLSSSSSSSTNSQITSSSLNPRLVSEYINALLSTKQLHKVIE